MSGSTIEQIADSGTSAGASEPTASDEQLVAMLVDRARSEGLQLTGEGGLLQHRSPSQTRPARTMSRGHLDHKIVDRTKIRDGHVANRPIYVVMAVTAEGHRDILGIWAGEADRAQSTG